MTKEKTKNSEEKAIEFEVCNSCNFKDEHKCPQHGAYLIVNDRPLPLKLPGRARSSLPHMFDIRPSPVHGEGVFAENKLPPRMRFGPYEGTKVSRQQAEEDSTYVFSVSWRRKTIFIDARDESRANWMRFVNCSRTKGEANLHAIQDRGRVYYWTCRVVDPGEELLVWYGDVYARELGLLDDGDSAQSEEESSDEYESEKGLKRKSEDEHKSDGSKRCKTNGTISNSTDFERHEAASVRLDVNGDDGSLNGKDGNRAARKRTASEETDTASSEGEANVTGRSGTIGKKTETALVDDFLSDRNRAVEHRIGATRKRSVLREIVIDDVGNTGQANGDRIGTASKRTASKVADAAGVCCVEEIDADGRSVGASSRNGQIGAESDVVFLGEENGSDIEVLSFADPSDVIVTKVDLQKKRFNLSRGRRTASTKTAPENLNLSTDSEIIELETKVNKKSGDSSKAVEKTKLPNESSSEENSEAANPKRKQNTEENHGKIINLTSNGEGDLVISGRRKTKRGQDSEMAEKQAENHWDKHRKLVKEFDPSETRGKCPLKRIHLNVTAGTDLDEKERRLQHKQEKQKGKGHAGQKEIEELRKKAEIKQAAVKELQAKLEVRLLDQKMLSMHDDLLRIKSEINEHDVRQQRLQDEIRVLEEKLRYLTTSDNQEEKEEKKAVEVYKELNAHEKCLRYRIALDKEIPELRKRLEIEDLESKLIDRQLEFKIEDQKKGQLLEQRNEVALELVSICRERRKIGGEENPVLKCDGQCENALVIFS